MERIPDRADEAPEDVTETERHRDEPNGAPDHERADLIEGRDEVQPEDEIDHRAHPRKTSADHATCQQPRAAANASPSLWALMDCGFVALSVPFTASRVCIESSFALHERSPADLVNRTQQSPCRMSQ
jgi:hypothetical protein